MKKWTKQELLDQLASKNKTKTYGIVKSLDRNFNGTMPRDIARGVAKMRGLTNQVTNCAKEIISGGTTKEEKKAPAKQPEQRKRRSSNEY